MDTIKWPFLKQNWGMQVVRSEGTYLYTSDGRKILDYNELQSIGFTAYEIGKSTQN